MYCSYARKHLHKDIEGMARQRYTTMRSAENSAHRSYGTAGRRDGAGIGESLGFKYEPYGKIYATSGFFLNQLFVQDRFTGHEWDYETSMYWAPYRNYRPDMLRWISRDPAGMADGPNVYGYVRGDPINSIDYFGLSGENCCSENANKAFSDASKKYDGGYRNWMAHMRHCTASCELTKSSGESCASLADLREYAGMMIPKKYRKKAMKKYGTYISDGDPFDLESNKLGRDCGSDFSATNCDACCRQQWRNRIIER